MTNQQRVNVAGQRTNILTIRQKIKISLFDTALVMKKNVSIKKKKEKKRTGQNRTMAIDAQRRPRPIQF